MSMSQLARILKDGVLTERLEYLGITGGEPTMVPHLEALVDDVVTRASSLQELAITTNGLVPHRTIAAVQSLIALAQRRDIRLVVNVSLDGLGETHDAIRGVPRAFDKVHETVSALVHLISKEDHARLSINTVISRANAEEINHLLAYAKSQGVSLNPSLVIETDIYFASRASASEFEITPNQLPKLRQLFSRLNLAARSHSPGSLQQRYYEHVLNMLHGRTRTLPCPFAEQEGCLIEPNGTVYVCGVAESCCFGNAFDQPFGSLWMNRRIWKRINESLGKSCRTCESSCFINACREFSDVQ